MGTPVDGGFFFWGHRRGLPLGLLLLEDASEGTKQDTGKSIVSYTYVDKPSHIAEVRACEIGALGVGVPRLTPQGGNLMSYFAGHMKKLHAADLRWAQIHNQRERESSSNRDIDKSKSHLNYDLANDEPVDYKEKIQERLKEGLKPRARVRRDSVLCNSWIITSDKGFFDRLSEQEQERFFKEAYKWFCDRYGEKNIAYAMVHRDETTPHMHLGVIPITKDGRLSSKELFNPQRLKEIQDRFPKYMQERGFQLERGIPSKQKHMEPVRYKNQQVLEHVKQLEKWLGDRVRIAKEIQRGDVWLGGIEVKEKGLFKKDRVELSKEDWEQVKTQASKALAYKHEMQEMGKEMYWLKERNKLLEKDQVKARQYDRLADLLGRDRLEKALEKALEQQQEKTRTRTKERSKERDISLDLER